MVKLLLKVHPERAERFAAASELWHGEFREERYAALDILAASKLDLADLPVLEQMLPDCDWWDLLDSLIGQMGRLLMTHPNARREKVQDWRISGHLWTRRAALLAQLHARSNTDAELLRETISLLVPEREFFIQKAIGWALREYAKTDDAWVKLTVNELDLTGLARREALKHAGQA